ncbi:MAG: hypothetical protein IIT57_13685, partial [Treponema sp.]|nr:hypothetical protein [Treponema sp.]
GATSLKLYLSIKVRNCGLRETEAISIEGLLQNPQNGELKALSVSVPPMIFVNSMELPIP